MVLFTKLNNKISDLIPTVENIQNGVAGSAISNGVEQQYDAIPPEEVTDDGFISFGAALIIPTNNYTRSNKVFPESGIYVQCMEVDGVIVGYINSITIPGFTGFPVEKTELVKIDPKYLPDNIGGTSGSGLPEVSTSDDGKVTKVVNGKWSVDKLSYNDLSDRPELFSGSYNDLSDKPIPDASTSTNGAFLRVVNGVWSAVTLPNVEEGMF